MELFEINRTILANQPHKLTLQELEAALAAVRAESDLERQRLVLACELSGHWPMSICTEVARALLPTAGPPGRRASG